MVVGYHHFRKPPYISQIPFQTWLGGLLLFFLGEQVAFQNFVALTHASYPRKFQKNTCSKGS